MSGVLRVGEHTWQHPPGVVQGALWPSCACSRPSSLPSAVGSVVGAGAVLTLAAALKGKPVHW